MKGAAKLWLAWAMTSFPMKNCVISGQQGASILVFELVK